MNKNYRVVWNHSLGDYIVTSELARGKVESSASSVVNDFVCPSLIRIIFISALSALTVNPAWAAPAYGEYASGSGNMLNIDGKTIDTNEIGAHGIFIEKGASADVKNSDVTTAGSKAYAVYAAGAGSNINIEGGSITTTGENSHGLVAGNGGKTYANNIKMNVSGTGLYANAATAEAKNIDVASYGYGVHGYGKGAVVNISDSNVTVAGKGAYAVLGENGAKTTSNNVSYFADGEGAFGGWVNGGSQLDIIGGSITTTGQGSIGVYGKSGALMNADGVTITSAGYGVYADNSKFNISNMTINSTLNGIYGAGANTELNISNTNVFTQGDNTSGIFVKNGAVGKFENIHVEVSGEKTYAIYAAGKDSKVDISGGSVTTQGVNSHGLVAGEKAELTVDTLQIASSGYGMYANQSVINATNVKIESATSGVYGTGADTYINITNAVVSGKENNGGAVKISGSASANVFNSKMIATELNASGLVASYSGMINARDIDVAITKGAYGLTTFFSGKIDVQNASINSSSGGVALFAASGGKINAENIVIDIDNVSGSDRESVAIWTSNSDINYSDQNVTVNDSTLKIKGDNAIGIFTKNTRSDIDINNTAMLVEHGTAILAGNAASTTVSLNNSTILSKKLIESSRVESDNNVRTIILNASNYSVLTGDIDINRNKMDESVLTLKSDSAWSGAANGLQTLNVEEGSRWNITGHSSIDNLNVRNSVLNFEQNNVNFKTLTVNGDYVADNATLIMSLALSDDKSDGDLFHITGNSSGITQVQVHNAGGKGSKTIEGIQLIKIDGSQNGEFKQDGRIVAGAYDYALIQDSNGYWRLNSSLTSGDPEEVGEDNGGEGDSGEGRGDGSVISPEKPQPKRTHRARPEVGSYIANLAAASNMFTLRASDRAGITDYFDPITGKYEKTTLWLRNKGAHGHFNENSGQLKSTTNSYMTQMGGDVAQWSLNGTDRFNLGVMAGYGNAKSFTRSKLTDYSAKGQVNGYNTGLYAGWQQDSVMKTGGFIDTWAAYNGFSNSVKGEGIGQESYKSKGLVASIESGYTFNFGDEKNCSLQPHAQIIWMGVKTADYTEQNGTRVRATGNNNVQTRVGVRAALDDQDKWVDAKNMRFIPYADLSWLHNSRKFGSKMDDVLIEQAGSRNIGTAELGLDAQLHKKINLTGNITQTVGGKGFNESSASLGLQVSF